MSSRIPKQNRGSSRPQRSRTSILTIAFAIAMAFFLVIGMVAIGVTELIGSRGGNDQPATTDLNQTAEDEADSEEQELRDRIESDPEDAQAHSQLAVLLANTGRGEEAIRHYELALQQEPDDVALRVSFARTLEGRGYDLDAQIQLERILDQDADNVEAMFMLAEIKERSNPPRQDEADQLYRQVIDTDPDSFYAEMASDRLADEPVDDEAESD